MEIDLTPPPKHIAERNSRTARALIFLSNVALGSALVMLGITVGVHLGRAFWG